MTCWVLGNSREPLDRYVHTGATVIEHGPHATELDTVIDGMKLNAERGAGRKLDREAIPDGLQEIVPLIEKWAFPCLEDQDDFIRLMSAERPDELDAFNRTIDQMEPAIREWRRELGSIDPRTTADHPYWAFLEALKLREASGASTDPEEIEQIKAMKAKFALELREERYKAATTEADDAFREGDFARYVQILSSFEDLLSSVQKKKIAIARKRSTR